VDFDTTKNLFIEGDNLDALKLLQETYLNKVKMIYIDPPYNTGNDFIYDDDFSEDTASYFRRSNQMDDLGHRVVTNTESNGRFHSDWLSMVYPRLKLARNVLRDDGVIFISIDDCEVANLRKICDEIYGEDNFISNIIWQSRTSISNDQPVSLNHNHTLIYCKSREHLQFGGEPLNEDEYRNPDNDSRGPWKPVPIDANKPGGETVYPITNPNTGVEYYPPNGRSWAFNRAEYQRLLEDDRITFGKTGESAPKKKLFLRERIAKGDLKTPSSLLMGEVGTTKDGTSETMELFDGKKVFSYPKPTGLIQRLMSYALTSDDDIVLDFFAGSATTAHAVMQFNALKEQSCKFIMVQWPEEIEGANEAENNCLAMGYQYLTGVSMERIRRAGKKIKEEAGLSAEKLDIGFRVLRVDTANMKYVYYTPDAITQDGLFGQVDNIKEDRNEEDLLLQVLTDWGVDLSLPIQPEQIAGKTVYFVEEDALAACFEVDIDEDFVKALAKRKPLRAVFRDCGYGSDSIKINVEQIFKLISPTTEVKSI
jgi:adenine-specific DNA-methyltransferase